MRVRTTGKPGWKAFMSGWRTTPIFLKSVPVFITVLVMLFILIPDPATAYMVGVVWGGLYLFVVGVLELLYSD